MLTPTSLDRAAEVMRAAKSILDWVIASLSFEELGFPQEPKIFLDNSREFTIISGYGSYNKVRARPKGGKCPDRRRRRHQAESHD